MRRLFLIPLVLLVALAAPAAAGAKAKFLDGHVIAPPKTSAKSVTVPVLLSERAERRLRLGKGVVRLVLPRRSKLTAPSQAGKTSISPSTLRAGDELRALVSLSRRLAKKLRKRSIPAMRVKRTRVVARASALSTSRGSSTGSAHSSAAFRAGLTASAPRPTLALPCSPATCGRPSPGSGHWRARSAPCRARSPASPPGSTSSRPSCPTPRCSPRSKAT